MTHFPYKSIYSRPNSFTILWRARYILCKCRQLPDCRGDAGSYSLGVTLYKLRCINTVTLCRQRLLNKW